MRGKEPTKFSGELEKDPNFLYLRALNALSDLRKGRNRNDVHDNIGEFSWLIKAVEKDPTVMQRLELSQEEYNNFKDSYDLWLLDQNKVEGE